jgi:nicotinate-nucleotide pyrophosphorylase (carboxylating)
MDFVELIRHAFAEDAVFEDATSIGCVPDGTWATAEILLKQEGTIAGLKWLAEMFHLRDPNIKVEICVPDGTFCKKGTVLAKVEGPAQALLSAERTTLNLLQHLSGIATLTAKCVALTKGTACKIFDTRKTIPGYRELQKYAVRMGGGTNHRRDLADQILVKNNHLALVPLGACVERIRAKFPGRKIEVEVSSAEELSTALQAGAGAMLLDNMTPEEVRHCVELNRGRAFLEASGGITLENVREYALAGVDGVSIGALTHSAPALDISLRMRTL